MARTYIPVSQRTPQVTAGGSTPGNMQAGNGGTVTVPVETAEFLLANAQGYRSQLEHAITTMQNSLRQGITWPGSVPRDVAGSGGEATPRKPMSKAHRAKIAAAARLRAQAQKQTAGGGKARTASATA